MIRNKETAKFIVAVEMLSADEVGRCITVCHPDDESDDNSTIQSSGVLYTLQKTFDEEGNLKQMRFALGGPDASVRNGMLFILTAEEAASGDYKYTASNW